MNWGPAEAAAVTAVVAAAALIPVLGAPAIAGRPLPERAAGFAARVALVVALGALLFAAAVVSWGRRRVEVDLGTWIDVGSFRMAPTLLLDSLSLPFAVFAIGLCGVIGAFAVRYLHREPGFNRFFLMLAMFATGILLVVLAGGLDMAFIGWEMIGLASAMLVAFFHERPLPVENGLRVFAVYRIGDVAMLGAAVLLHHHLGAARFDVFLGVGWPDGQVPLSAGVATSVGGLLLLAAMVKCGAVPFSGWLPRAMEGPTPSSAIFYGALSVHAGAYLLLRCGALLDAAPGVAAATVVVGAATAVYATLVARVQTDIKSALGFASLTQVGVILVEIGLGLRYLALIHIVGHTCMRSLQFLRAPSILHDVHEARNAVGGHVDAPAARRPWLSGEARRRVYRFALERGYLDAWLDAWVVRPAVAACRGLDALERRWCRALGGRRGEGE
jgi:NAD(P)H-quinone oxidoreductase subunit 5